MIANPSFEGLETLLVERVPFVQSIAGKEGLTKLLTTSFNGVQFANDYPLVKASNILHDELANVIYRLSISSWVCHCYT